MTVLSLTWESPYLEKTVFILKHGPGFQLGLPPMCADYPSRLAASLTTTVRGQPAPQDSPGAPTTAFSRLVASVTASLTHAMRLQLDHRQPIRTATVGYTEIVNAIGSTSIRHRSDTEMSDRCLIVSDLMVFASRGCPSIFTLKVAIKWPTFCRQYFRMHFVECKDLYFDSNF